MNKERTSLYAAGLLQGIASVSFPAVSTILTNPQSYNFTSAEYGSLFLPQAILSIITALLNSVLCNYFTANRTLAIGLTASLLSMFLLASSTLIMSHPQLSYPILLLATTFLGIGFGIVAPTLNRMMRQLSPKRSDQALLALNTLLGVGTAIAPASTAFFSLIGFWWGSPLLLTLAIMILLLSNLRISFPEEDSFKKKNRLKDLPLLPLTLFVFFAFLYGIIETINGNWTSIYMKSELDAPLALQSLALSTFWACVTLGRFFSAVISKWINQQITFRIAPFIAALAFLLLSSPLLNQTYEYLFAFGLMGIGCSILLPLLISFGGTKLSPIASSIPGIILSFYLLGYGVTAFGIGALKQFGFLTLREIFFLGSLISLVLGLFSFYLTQKKNEQGA